MPGAILPILLNRYNPYILTPKPTVRFSEKIEWFPSKNWKKSENPDKKKHKNGPKSLPILFNRYNRYSLTQKNKDLQHFFQRKIKTYSPTP